MGAGPGVHRGKRGGGGATPGSSFAGIYGIWEAVGFAFWLVLGNSASFVVGRAEEFILTREPLPPAS